MAAESIHTALSDYIKAELLFDETYDLAPEDELLLDGVIDSIGATRLVGFVEDTWGLRVPAQDVTVENFGSVNQMVSYIASRGDE